MFSQAANRFSKAKDNICSDTMARLSPQRKMKTNTITGLGRFNSFLDAASLGCLPDDMQCKSQHNCAVLHTVPANTVTDLTLQQGP